MTLRSQNLRCRLKTKQVKSEKVRIVFRKKSGQEYKKYDMTSSLKDSLKIHGWSFMISGSGRKAQRELKKLHSQAEYFLVMVWELRKLVSNNQGSFQSRINRLSQLHELLRLMENHILEQSKETL